MAYQPACLPGVLSSLTPEVFTGSYCDSSNGEIGLLPKDVPPFLEGSPFLGSAADESPAVNAAPADAPAQDGQ
jgi:hypothetical protein